MPTVSVVVPTYRHATTVADAIESVFAQTFVDVEVIVINDGSPDETAAVLAPYVAAGRIHYFEQPNAGQGAARNAGIAKATGKFIALLDDDDLWPPDKLEWQVLALDKSPGAVLAYGDAEAFGERTGRSDPGRGGDVRDALQMSNFIISPGQTLIRADAIAQVGAFDPTIWGCDDWDLYLRLAAIGPFVYEPRVALHYRYHAENASRQTRRMFDNGLKVLHKHLGRFPRPRTAGRWYRARRFVANMDVAHRVAAGAHARSRGDYFTAIRHLSGVVRRWPFWPLEKLVAKLTQR